MSDSPTIWQHAQKFSGSFDNNYYGLVVSGVRVMPKLTSNNSSEKLTFQPSLTNCVQKKKANCHETCMSDAPTIWQHAKKFSRSFNINYYGPVDSGVWVTPQLSTDDSTEKLTFQPSLTHCAQKNGATSMKLA